MERSDLQAALGCLGYSDEGGRYVVEPDCLEAVKDLIVALRGDSEKCQSRLDIGQASVLQKDLLPMVRHHHGKAELLEVVLRLLVNLTQPAKLSFENNVPDDLARRTTYLKLESILADYKTAFVEPQVLAVLAQKLAGLLEETAELRSETARLSVERILLLVRNVLLIGQDAGGQLSAVVDDCSVHDQLLWAMERAGLADLLIYLVNSDQERDAFVLHVLEIVCLMLREQRPEELAQVGNPKTAGSSAKERAELHELLERDQQQSRSVTGWGRQPRRRPNKFGGSYTVGQMRSIDDRHDVVLTGSLGRYTASSAAGLVDVDAGKSAKKRPKNRAALNAEPVHRRSAFAVRLFLKEFCNQFLQSSYNLAMKKTMELVERGRSQPNDETYYFWTMAFLMGFLREQAGDRLALEVEAVSETVQLHTFHYVQTQAQYYEENARTDKPMSRHWVARLHLALKAYRELLMFVDALRHSCWKLRKTGDLSQGDEETLKQVESSVETVESNIFYMAEYRDLLAGLVHGFNEAKYERVYLRDLILTLYNYMKMLERFAKSHGSVTVAKKRSRRGGRRRRRGGGSAVVLGKRVAVPRSPEELDSFWSSSVAEKLAMICQGVVPTNTTASASVETTTEKTEEISEANPEAESLSSEVNYADLYDPGSELDSESQCERALWRVQALLRRARTNEAVTTLKTAGRLWPEAVDRFGSADGSAKDQFDTLKRIFFETLPDEAADAFPELDCQMDVGGLAEGGADEKADDGGDNEYGVDQLSTMEVVDQEFDLKSFYRSLAKANVLKSLMILLGDFEQNSKEVNHALAKLLHRLCVDCGLVALMYQVRLFSIFDRLFQVSPLVGDLSKQPYAELVAFAEFVLRHFFERARVEPKLFVETLFLKTAKEAEEMESGYETYEEKQRKAEAAAEARSRRQQEREERRAQKRAAGPRGRRKWKKRASGRRLSGGDGENIDDGDSWSGGEVATPPKSDDDDGEQSDAYWSPHASPMKRKQLRTVERNDESTSKVNYDSISAAALNEFSENFGSGFGNTDLDRLLLGSSGQSNSRDDGVVGVDDGSANNGGGGFTLQRSCSFVSLDGDDDGHGNDGDDDAGLGEENRVGASVKRSRILFNNDDDDDDDDSGGGGGCGDGDDGGIGRSIMDANKENSPSGREENGESAVAIKRRRVRVLSDSSDDGE